MWILLDPLKDFLLLDSDISRGLQFEIDGGNFTVRLKLQNGLQAIMMTLPDGGDARIYCATDGTNRTGTPPGGRVLITKNLLQQVA